MDQYIDLGVNPKAFGYIEHEKGKFSNYWRKRSIILQVVFEQIGSHLEK